MENILFDFIAQYIELNDDEKQALLELDIFKTVKKGTVLLSEGEKSNKGYFVLKGCIRTYYNVDGEEKTTAFYTEMEGTTPNCVTTGLGSDYYIACVEDCVITESTPGMEAEMFEKFPKFESLCRILGEQVLAKTQISFDLFKTLSPENRYINLQKNRPDLLQRVPQHQLASYIGVKPQSLSRIRQRLAEKEKS